MGINIILYRALENHDGKISFSRADNWDSVRQGIDKEVNSDLPKTYFMYKNIYQNDGECYWRPLNLEQAELWCWDKAKEIGSDSAHDRWIQVFRRMKHDYSYWFLTSY